MATAEGTIFLYRELDDGGLIEFEERPTGFRAYWYTPPNPSPTTKRIRFPSVTTVLGRISPDDALRDWYEAQGAAAALQLERDGYLKNVAPENAADAIREANMGAKATAKQAANRGIRVHAVLQDYAERGDVPNPADYEPSDRGYIKGLIRWIMHADPQPVAVERLVVHPEFGFAGRLDLRARIRGREYIVDLKTNRRCQIYRKACLQALAYHVADIRCGAETADGGEMLVAVGPDGTYAEGLPPVGTAEAWAAGLEYHRKLNEMGDIREV
jgi:hypothetical protein